MVLLYELMLQWAEISTCSNTAFPDNALAGHFLLFFFFLIIFPQAINIKHIYFRKLGQ